MVGAAVLSGTVRAEGVLKGTVAPSMTAPRYPGPYDVTPAADAQALATKGLVMDSDVTVGGMGEAIEKAGKDAIRTIVDGSYTGEYRNEEVTEVRPYGLYGMSGLTSLDLPAVTTIGDSGLRNMSGLTSLDLPAVTTVGHNVLMGCASLTSIELPAMTRCGNALCQDCTALKRLVLPKLGHIGWAMCQGVTSLEVFDTGAWAFSSSAFMNCSSLVAVIIRNSTRAGLGGVGEFAGTPIANGTGYIYVPAALVDKYKAATNWSVYADQIRAIEDYPEICDPE